MLKIHKTRFAKFKLIGSG